MRSTDDCWRRVAAPRSAAIVALPIEARPLQVSSAAHYAPPGGAAATPVQGRSQRATLIAALFQRRWRRVWKGDSAARGALFNAIGVRNKTRKRN